MTSNKPKIFMRRTALMAILSFVVSAMMAIPAKREWRTVTQPDGTKLEVMLVGDENFHYYVTRDDVALVERDGVYYYAKIEQRHLIPTGVPASDKPVSEAAARQNGYATAAKAKEAEFKGVRKGPKKVGEREHATYLGAKKGLIILVNFTDKRFEPIENRDDSMTVNNYYSTLANTENYTSEWAVGSLRDYFRAQSYGQFDLTFDVVGPITADNDYSYYGRDLNGEEGNDLKVVDLVKEMCAKVDAIVDFKEYDWDKNGEADVVYLLYAGFGQATGGGSSTIWPHMWTLKDAVGMNLIDALPVHDNISINTYACSNELYNNGTRMGIGVICHEFSHCLGLPDVYDTGLGTNPGMGSWDLMNSGSYNGPMGIGWVPAGYTAYERNYAGWLDFKELNENEVVEQLRPVTKAPDACKMVNDGHPDEYYILESRYKEGWDAYLPESGLLIYHVDYDEGAWTRNEVNASTVDGNMERMSLVRSNGYRYGSPVTFPSTTNTVFGDTSRPKAVLNNANTDGDFLLHKEVSEITRQADGVISFVFTNLTQANGIESPAVAGKSAIEWYDMTGRCLSASEKKSHRGLLFVRDSQGKVVKTIGQ